MNIRRALIWAFSVTVATHMLSFSQKPERSRELVLRIVSPFGSHTAPAELVLRSTASKEVIRPLLGTVNADSFRVSGLQANRYFLDVKVPGFVARKGVEILLTNGQTYQTICLSLMNPFDRFGSAPTVQVSGRVRLIPGRRKKGWLSFLGIYSGARYEVETDDDGSFSVQGLVEGVYVVAVSRGETNPTTRVVTLRVGKNEITLE